MKTASFQKKLFCLCANIKFFKEYFAICAINFISLREDYEEKDFDDQFNCKSKEKAYVFEDHDGLK